MAAVTGRPSLRARVGSLIPGAGDIAFNRDRNRAVPSSRAPRGGYPKREFAERDPHVVVVPIEGPQFPDWQPGTRNFYFEAYQSAVEGLGSGAVSVLDVGPGEASESWHRRLLDLVHDVQATHIVTHIEHDPGSPDVWTWDVAWNRLAPSWDGALLGVMFDSAFDLVTMKSRRLARMSPGFVGIDICAPMDGVLVKGTPEVGPVTMPMSRQSMELIDERLANVAPEHDVSFIGALYPYRVQLIESLKAEGIDVVVNPHRPDVTQDFHSSRTNQPSWLDYMAGLAGSRMTVNFSRSSAGGFEQLKTRVIEATVAGTFLLTDDRNRTRDYFEPEVEFGYFADAGQLKSVVEKWTGVESQRRDGAARAQKKARRIITTDFWTRIDRGLEHRSLPRLEGLRAVTSAE